MENFSKLRQCKSYNSLNKTKIITRKLSIGERLNSIKHSISSLKLDSKKLIITEEDSMETYLTPSFKNSSHSISNKFLIDSSKNIVLNVMHRGLSVPSLRRTRTREDSTLSNKSSLSSISSSYSSGNVSSCSTTSKVAKPLPKHAIYAPFQKGFNLRQLDSEEEFGEILTQGFQKQGDLQLDIPTLYLTLTPSCVQV
ncbi:hypothetical protein K502DRAFT_361773 [Neoconidiobolus thromboides FSU 785]|nr:hypothetical protein K502DRAFT_361773 [Neoconidiobolus thromboides FSU 785]